MTEATLNTFAEAYVNLALCKTRYDLWDIYWYAEGPFWRRTSMRFSRDYKIIPDYEIADRKHGKTLEDIRDESRHLLACLGLYKKTAEAAEMQRVDYLIDHVNHLNVRTRMMLGEAFSFDEMTRELYCLVAPEYDYGRFDDAVREMGQALPGGGSHTQKIQAFLNRVRIPRETLLATITDTTKAFHDMTLKRMPEVPPYSLLRTRVRDLPDNMAFLSILFGYDYERVEYERNYNLSYDWTVDKIVECVGHECEPGHVTHFLKRTQTLVDTCWPEMAIISQYSSSSAYWEGAARCSVYMCFDNNVEELANFERDVVFAAAKLDRGLAELMPLWHKFCDAAGYAKLEASRKVWDGKWSEQQAGDFLERYMFAEPGAGLAMAKSFANMDSGHFVAHDYARDVVKEYYRHMAPGISDQWRLYSKLCNAHMSMEGIRDKTYRVEF